MTALKKIFTSLLISIAILSTVVLPVAADSNNPTAQEIFRNEDGSSVVNFTDGSQLYISKVEKSESMIDTCTTTPTYYRTATYTDSNGNLQWKYELSGTFSYVYGKSSTCISASYTNEDYDTGWSFSDGEAIKSGNMAIGKGVYKLKMLFVTIKTFNIDISLTCDVYGNVT